MKLLSHPALVALGIASVTSLFLTAPLISSAHDFVYHLHGSASALFAYITLGFAVLWFVLFILIWLANYFSRLFVPIWSGLLLVFPYVLLRNWAWLSEASLPHDLFPHETIVFFLILPGIFFGALVLLWPDPTGRIFRRIQHFFQEIFGFTSILGLFILGNLAGFGWQARHLNTPPQLHRRLASATASGQRPRVIWLVLDELSYQQIYAQRFPGLDLPAFDRLAAESAVFTHVVPAGTLTGNILPSLLTGIPVDRLRLTADGNLRSLHNPVADAWQPFDQHDTVFQDALNLNYSTGISGWYNPYCRILPQVLDRCFWDYRLPYKPWIGLIHPHRSIFGPEIGALHVADYRSLLIAGDDLLQDRSTTFAFLHMPIPHPGGIYDRRHQTFTPSGGSYIDNLALADKYLAHVRRLLEQTGQWDSSTIVLMGDHGWRTSFIWSITDAWTAEDEQASNGGKFDDRPAYIVKLPNQQAGTHIDTRFAARDTRKLLDALLAQRIHNPAELQAWVEEQNPR